MYIDVLLLAFESYPTSLVIAVYIQLHILLHIIWLQTIYNQSPNYPINIPPKKKYS